MIRRRGEYKIRPFYDVHRYLWEGTMTDGSITHGDTRLRRDTLQRAPTLAHIAEDGRCHLLEDHLMGTYQKAAEFAAAFGCGEWGRLVGLWHDLGKLSKEVVTHG